MLDVQRIVTGPLRANCYIASIESDAVVIDPGDQFELIDEAIEARNLEVHAVLCTHAHYDHLGAAVPISEKYGALFHLHEDDAALLARVNLFRRLVHDAGAIPIPTVDVSIVDAQALRFGTLEASVVHTPGHSPGSVCFEMAGKLFVGDTVSSGELGRSDFPGGDADALASSIRLLAERFEPHTVLFPGHGDVVLLAELLSESPGPTAPHGKGPVEL